MDAKELIKSGKLSEARKQLIEDVKSSPVDMGKRTMLFQVHILLGEWDKAERQLDVVSAQDPGRESGIQVYKNIVSAEKERIEFYNNGRRPSFVPKAPQYIEMYFAAREKMAGNKIDEAIDLFEKINSQIPEISGTLNGKDFTGFSDTDANLLFFLETIVHEQHMLVPFEAIRELTISPPKTLFDLIWASATITSWEGLTLNCFLPVIYTNSFQHDDDRIKLGRLTEWSSLGGPFSRGTGQRVFQIGEEDVPVLEIKEIIFNAADSVKEDEKRA